MTSFPESARDAGVPCFSEHIELGFGASAHIVAQLAVLEDAPTRAAVDAERAVLATLEGGCSAPIGALAEIVEGEDEEELWVRAIALSPDGALSVRMSATGSPADAHGVGARLAQEMLADGAGQLGQPGPAATTEADKVREA